MQDTVVVGIVGPMGSGKGVVADMLVARGFTYYSLSDRVREEAVSRGAEKFERTLLQDIGNDLRTRFGGEVLAKRTGIFIIETNQKKVVIDGIRNPSEIAYLRKTFPHTVIIGVEATPDKRFELLSLRHRPSDPLTREDFDRMEARDRGVGEAATGQQVDACLASADSTIHNVGTLGEFKKEIEAVIEKYIG